jgi:hypothetical protein
MAEDKPVDTFEEVFEDEEAPKEAQSMHRIRANSSIMQLKKILGMCLGSFRGGKASLLEAAKLSEAPRRTCM